MTDRYILVDGHPTPEPDLMKWSEWYGKIENRRVKSTDVGAVQVSTIFLGLDHNFAHVGPPLLYETMIFGGEHDGWMDRYRTVEDARVGHEKAVSLVLSSLSA